MKNIVSLLKFFSSSMTGEVILWIFVFDLLITGSINTGCKDLCIVLLLGLIIRIACVFFEKYFTYSIAKDNDARLIAKKKLLFFLPSFFVSGIAYYLLYHLIWFVLLDFPDKEPYRLAFVSFLFGVFSAIYIIEYKSSRFANDAGALT